MITKENILNTIAPRVIVMKKNLKVLISSALVTVNFLIPQKTFSMEEVDQVDHHTVKAIIETHLTNNPNLLNSSKDKDIVVFLGNTGAGKSTLINYLSGKELEVNRFNHIILKDPNDLSAMAIGVGHDSKTFLPGFIQAGDLLFYDLPGFKDTRGTATSLVNACFIKRIIENAKSATLVFVVGMGQVNSDRADSFKVLLRQAEQLLPNQPIEYFSSLVVTQSDQESDDLSAYLTEVVDVTQIPTLDFWIKNQKIAQVSKPKGKNIDQNERENILRLIQGTNYNKIQSINIGATYRHKDQNNIKDIYDREIADIVNQLINISFDLNSLSSLDITALETNKQYLQNSFFQDVSSALESSPLIQLLRPISKGIYKSARGKMERNLFHRLINISAEISNIIREQERREARELYEALVQAENDRRGEAEARYRNEESRRVQAEGQVVTLQQDLQAEVTKNTQNAIQIATLQQSLQHETTRYNQAAAQVTTLQQDIQADIAQNTQNAIQIATLQQSLQHETARYTQATAQIATLQQGLQTEISNKHQANIQVATLQGSLNAETKRCKEVEDKFTSVRNSEEQYKRLFNESSNTVTRVENDIDKKISDLFQLAHSGERSGLTDLARQCRIRLVDLMRVWATLHGRTFESHPRHAEWDKLP